MVLTFLNRLLKNLSKENLLVLFLKEVTTLPDKKKGLMFRKDKLPLLHGMLFTYDKPQIIGMWMKNTFIPLDIIFLDENFVVIDIMKNMIPHSTEIRYSAVQSKYAIELNKGDIDQLNISIGTNILPIYVKNL